MMVGRWLWILMVGVSLSLPGMAWSTDAEKGTAPPVASEEMQRKVDWLEKQVDTLQKWITEGRAQDREALRTFVQQLKMQALKEAELTFEKRVIALEGKALEKFNDANSDRRNMYILLSILTVFIISSLLFQHFTYKKKSREIFKKTIEEKKREIYQLVEAQSRDTVLRKDTKIRVLAREDDHLEELLKWIVKFGFREKNTNGQIISEVTELDQAEDAGLTVLHEDLTNNLMNEIVEEQSVDMLYFVYAPKDSISLACNKKYSWARNSITLFSGLMDLLRYHACDWDRPAS